MWYCVGSGDTWNSSLDNVFPMSQIYHQQHPRVFNQSFFGIGCVELHYTPSLTFIFSTLLPNCQVNVRVIGSMKLEISKNDIIANNKVGRKKKKKCPTSAANVKDAMNIEYQLKKSRCHAFVSLNLTPSIFTHVCTQAYVLINRNVFVIH